MNISCQLNILCAGLLTVFSTLAHSATYDVTGTSIVRDAAGGIAGVVDNTVTGLFDDSGPTSLSLTTYQPYFGFLWAAEGAVFGEGDWTFEACLPDGSTQCTAPTPIGMTVGANQWGGHFLGFWGVNQNFDILNVWDVTTDPSGVIHLAPTDPDGDGVPGIPMQDGPFKNFSWSFELTLTPVPIPPAAWLFGSGLLGLAGISTRRKTVP